MEEQVQRYLEEAFPFWQKLSSADRGRLLSHTAEVAYRAGENVHGGKNGCTGLVVVVSGRLRAYLVSEEGREITLFRLIEGDVCVLSAGCVIRNLDLDLLVEAETDSRLYIVAPQAYEEVGSRCREMETYLSEQVSARLSEAMWVMEQSLFRRFDRRLAEFLLLQASLEQQDTLSLTQEQVARHLGSAREVVSRMLKYFQQEGWVAVSRGGVTLLDRKGLAELAGMKASAE